MENEWKMKFYYMLAEGKMNEAVETLMTNNPRSLLKFCNGSFEPDGSNVYIKSLQEDELWMSCPLQFNDPFDCAFNFGDIGKRLADYYKNKDTDENSNVDYSKLESYASEKFGSIIDSMRNLSYVCCLTELENIEKITMWSHYANQHKGFCIEYDKEELFNYYMFGENQNYKLYPVIYEKENEFINLKLLVNNDKNGYVDFFVRNIMTKSLDWEYENEWRIYAAEHDKPRNGFYVPTIPAKAVYIGCRASVELKEQLKRVCKTKGIKLYQMKIVPSSFNLIYDEVPLK